jgi:hypothetical protein
MTEFGADPARQPKTSDIDDNLLSNFQGWFAVNPQGKYMSGARTIIRINGELIGFAFSVAWNIKTEQDEIWQIDDWTPYEIAPKRISVEGTLGCLYQPIAGSPTKRNIMSNVLSFMFQKYVTIEVRDSLTDALLFKTSKAVITGNQTSISTENPAQMTLSWKAIGWVDEKVPNYPFDVPPPGKSTASSPIDNAVNTAANILIA